MVLIMLHQYRRWLTNDFYMGQYEVTQSQWESVMSDANPWLNGTAASPTKATYGKSANHPAYNNKWYHLTGVGGFLDRLNESVGCDTSALPTNQSRYHPSNIIPGCYRLPTESEWEYSARAGTTSSYHFGELNSDENGKITNLPNYAWIKENTHGHWSDEAGYLGRSSHPDYGSHPVGQKLPNPWGLYDMIGNVAEIVYDAEYIYSGSKDGSGCAI